MKGAKCVQSPQLFHQVYDDENGDFYIDEAEARSICKQCPSKVICRDFAVTRREAEGIWGDTDSDERRRIRLKNNQNLPDLLCEIAPAIENVAELYALAQEALYVKNQMQTLQRSRR